jgi:hypothetical protein
MLWPFSNIVEKSWIADAGQAGVGGASSLPAAWSVEDLDPSCSGSASKSTDANGQVLDVSSRRSREGGRSKLEASSAIHLQGIP